MLKIARGAHSLVMSACGHCLSICGVNPQNIDARPLAALYSIGQTNTLIPRAERALRRVFQGNRCKTGVDAPL
jgi:hypothetical protein